MQYNYYLRIILLLAVVLCLFIAGCGGGSDNGSGANPVPTVTIKATPSSITSGANTILEWSSTNGTSVKSSNFEAATMSGSKSFSPSETTTYMIIVAGPGGDSTANITVTVIPSVLTVPTIRLTATPTAINEGESTLLEWTSSNARSVTDSNFGASTVNGSKTVSPTSTKTFNITVLGSGGEQTASVTVTLKPSVPITPEDPILSLTLIATPSIITMGENTRLSWSSKNATSVIHSNFGASSANGSIIIFPTGSITYSVTVSGNGEQITKEVTVTVIPGPAGTVIMNPNDNAFMVSVPTGLFTMGTEYDAQWDGPKTQSVNISGFWIYKYDVTVAQYRAFCAATGYALPPWPGNYYSWAGKSGWDDAALQLHPIVNVTWYDAKAYADWAKVKLPTEAQWEYAARGAQGRNYPWGGMATATNSYNGWNDTKCANFRNSYSVYKSTWIVGSFPGASWCVAQDMAGNVKQWCDDWYGNYSTALVLNPLGPPTGSKRVLRGGSWRCFENENRGAYRDKADPNLHQNYVGFRCVSTELWP